MEMEVEGETEGDGVEESESEGDLEGESEGEYIPHIKEMKEGNFEKFFKGKSGYVYIVDSSYFCTDDRVGMKMHEFISHEPVPVIGCIIVKDIYLTLLSCQIHLERKI